MTQPRLCWCSVSALTVLLLMAPPAAQSARPAANPRLEVTVYGDQVRWFGPPGMVVRAELIGPGGLKATAAGRNGSYAEILRFAPESPGGDTRILPGDVVTVTPESGDVLHVVAPELVADTDSAGRRIVGRAPPGVLVEVIRDFDKPLGTARTGPDGDLNFDLSAVPDVGRGFTGQIRFVTADQIAFNTWYDVVDVSLWADTRRLEVRASLAATVTIAVRSPGGRTTSHTARFDRPAYFAGPFRCPDCLALEPGSLVTVTKRGVLNKLDFDWTGEMPTVGVRLDRDANVVRGHGPPHGTVTVAVGDVKSLRRDKPVLREVATLDATGQFEISLDGSGVIAPGWMARLTHQLAPAVTLFDEDLLRIVRASVWGPHLEGIVAPSVAVTVTLSGVDGIPKAEAVTNSDLAGAFTLWFGSMSGLPGGEGPLILPGDTLQIDEHGSGDPVSMTVPALAVQADAATDTVSAEAPPGYDVRVGVGEWAVTRPATWQDDRYTADFAGISDLAPGTVGPVALLQGSGRFEFHTCWAITSLELLLGVSTVGGQADLRGSGCAGRTVRVRWLTPDGRQVGDFRKTLPPEGILTLGSAARWLAAMQDSSGRGLEMTPGDRFEVDVGDDHLTVTVPPLTVETDVALDTISGLTTPDTTVTVGARHHLVAGETFGDTSVSDASGRYRYDYRGSFDIQHGDFVGAGIRTVEGYQVRRVLQAPGLLLDLNDARLTGVSLPDGVLVATLMAGQTLRATVTTRTPVNGAFEIVFRTADGVLARPQAGESMLVTVRADDRHDEMAMVVPQLSFSADSVGGAVAGRATPGGTLLVQALGTFFSAQGTDGVGTNGSAYPPIAADATWTLLLKDFGGPGSTAMPVTLFPGLLLAAQYRLPEGHLATLRSYQPVANVEHGGPHVCGAGPAGAAVTTTVTDAVGTVRGRAAGRVGDDLRFAVILRDVAGQPVITQAGDTVRTVVGDSPITVELPELTMDVQWRVMRPGWAWPGTLVTGSGPPLRQTYVRAPVADCFTGAVWTGIREYVNGSDALGAFRTHLDHQTGGGGVELAFLTPDRHRFYRHVLRRQARIYVDTDRVTGRGMPLQPVTLTLRAADGTLRGHAAAIVDADGRYDLSFRDGAGQPVASYAGDTVHLTAGGETAEVPVQALTFDFSSQRGLLGLTRPGAVVQLALHLTDDTTRRFERLADPTGRFDFTPEDIPARESWRLGDIRDITTVLPLPDGHEIVAEAGLGPARRLAVYLPFALRRSR